MDQYLIGNGRTGPACPLAEHRCEITAGAVAAQGQPGGVTAEVCGVGGNPGKSRLAILKTGREAVLWRQAVIDAGDDDAAATAETPAHDIVGVQIARSPAAAVQIDQYGQVTVFRRFRRPVEAHRNLPLWAGSSAVFDARQIVRGARQGQDRLTQHGAAFHRRQFVAWRRFTLGEFL